MVARTIAALKRSRRGVDLSPDFRRLITGSRILKSAPNFGGSASIQSPPQWPVTARPARPTIQPQCSIFRKVASSGSPLGDRYTFSASYAEITARNLRNGCLLRGIAENESAVLRMTRSRTRPHPLSPLRRFEDRSMGFLIARLEQNRPSLGMKTGCSQMPSDNRGRSQVSRSARYRGPYKRRGMWCKLSAVRVWLPGMDSNHDSRLQRPLSYH